MNIYERLIEDHNKQRKLIDMLLGTSGDGEFRRNVWRDLYAELEAHALAEEQVFYSQMMEHPEGTEGARHSVHEHKEMADCAEALNDTSMDQGAWLQTMKKLAHLVRHHLDEEEEEMFVKAKTFISADRAEAMVAEFDKNKAREIKDAVA